MSEFPLTEQQLFLLSLFSAGIVQVIKIVWMGLFKKPKPSTGTLGVILFVVAIPLAYFFAGVTPPAYGGDLAAYAIALLEAALSILVVARVVYEKLLEGVLGWTDEKVFRSSVLAP